MITNIEKIKLLDNQNLDFNNIVSICTNMSYNNFKGYIELCIKKILIQ